MIAQEQSDIEVNPMLQKLVFRLFDNLIGSLRNTRTHSVEYDQLAASLKKNTTEDIKDLADYATIEFISRLKDRQISDLSIKSMDTLQRKSLEGAVKLKSNEESS